MIAAYYSDAFTSDLRWVIVGILVMLLVCAVVAAFNRGKKSVGGVWFEPLPQDYPFYVVPSVPYDRERDEWSELYDWECEAV